MKIPFFLLLITLVITGCKKTTHEIKTPTLPTVVLTTPAGIKTPTIKNGVYGFIKEWKGDFMPGFGPNGNSGTIDSVQKEIHLFEQQNLNAIQHARLEPYGQFWSISQLNISPKFIIKANEYGFYEAELPAGEYSSLIKIDNDRYFINRFNGSGSFGPVLILQNSVYNIHFDIDYDKTE